MPACSLRNLCKSYGPAVVVDGIDLEIEDGELVVLLGPSGCGKTTTLRMIAGFVEPTSGSIVLAGRDITHMPSFARNIGVVFQNYALFPHLTVFENVAFGLRRRRVDAAAIRTRAHAALEMVHMAHMAGRLPRELSGGQQQRVAIARATVIEPGMLLLDEPLSNLDAKLRLSIRQEIRNLQQSLGITTLLVTHDQEEAMSVADRVVILEGGKVRQIGAPDDVYANPASRFVAEFIGGANFFDGRADGLHRFQTATGFSIGGLALDPDCRSIVVRPEGVSLSFGPAEGANAFHACITNLTYLGPGVLVEARLATGETLNAYVNAGGEPGILSTLRTTRAVVVHIPPHAVRGIPGGARSPATEV